jgi:hypothetical protein
MGNKIYLSLDPFNFINRGHGYHFKGFLSATDL